MNADRVCQVAEERKEKARDRIQVAKDFFQAKRQEFHDKREANREKANETVDRAREKYHEKTDAAVDKLLASDPNPEQKAAALEFKAAVEALIETRNAEHRALNDAFYEDMRVIADDTIDTVTGDVDDFKAEVTAAFDEAIADCQAGIDKQTIFTELKDRLKIARDDFKVDKDNFGIKDAIKSRLQQRKADQVELLKGFRDDVRAEGDILKEKWNDASEPPLPGNEEE